MSRRFSIGDGNTLRVTTTAQDQQHVSEAHLRRTLRSLLAQKERNAQQLETEIAGVREMLAACQELGIKGEDMRLPVVASSDEVPAEAPKPTLGQRAWSFLTKPRALIGQQRTDPTS